MLHEIISSTTASSYSAFGQTSIVVPMLLVLGLVLVLPLLYYHGRWNDVWGDDDDVEGEYKLVNGVWKLTPFKPVEPPTVCTFYSEGMKEAINRILKKDKEEPVLPAKSIEVD